MGWRSKFVLLLIVYAAGFATAVYCLAPTPESQPGQPQPVARIRSAVKTEELVRSVHSGMHKCLGFSKEAALEAAKMIQAKIEEAKSQQGG